MDWDRAGKILQTTLVLITAGPLLWPPDEHIASDGNFNLWSTVYILWPKFCNMIGWGTSEIHVTVSGSWEMWHGRLTRVRLAYGFIGTRNRPLGREINCLPTAGFNFNSDYYLLAHWDAQSPLHYFTPATYADYCMCGPVNGPYVWGPAMRIRRGRWSTCRRVQHRQLGICRKCWGEESGGEFIPGSGNGRSEANERERVIKSTSSKKRDFTRGTDLSFSNAVSRWGSPRNISHCHWRVVIIIINTILTVGWQSVVKTLTTLTFRQKRLRIQ